MTPPDDVMFDDESDDYYNGVAKGEWYIAGSYNPDENRISIYFHGFCHSPFEPFEGELCEMTLHELLHWAAGDEAHESQVHQMAYRLTWDRIFKEV